MAEKLAAPDKPVAPGAPSAPKTEGVVNLWRSTRTMQIWSEVSSTDDAFGARAIGDEITLLVKREGKELWRWSAPRGWWDEQLAARADPVNAAGLSVPRETLVTLLSDLDAKRPALVTAASKLAAATQANMEAEDAEIPDRLRIVPPLSP